MANLGQWAISEEREACRQRRKDWEGTRSRLQGGWPTGKGKKLSSSQAQLGQATCLAVAYFFSISCGPSTPSALYTLQNSDTFVELPIEASLNPCMPIPRYIPKTRQRKSRH